MDEFCNVIAPSRINNYAHYIFFVVRGPPLWRHWSDIYDNFTRSRPPKRNPFIIINI